MPRVIDFVPTDEAGRYPVDQLVPEARALLEMELPANYPQDRAALIASKITGRLPDLTLRSREARARFPGKGSAEAVGLLDQWERVNPVGRVALQSGAGSMEALPGGKKPLVRTDLVPQPKGIVERVARGVGGATSFGALTAGLSAAGVPPPLAMGLVAGAAPAENLAERGVRAGTTTVLGAIAPPVGGMASRIARARVGSLADLGVNAAVQGGMFGAAQPAIEAKIMGRDVDPQELLRGGLDFALVSALMGAPGLRGSRGAPAEATAQSQGRLPRRTVTATVLPREHGGGESPRRIAAEATRPDAAPAPKQLGPGPAPAKQLAGGGEAPNFSTGRGPVEARPSGEVIPESRQLAPAATRLPERMGTQVESVAAPAEATGVSTSVARIPVLGNRTRQEAFEGAFEYYRQSMPEDLARQAALKQSSEAWKISQNLESTPPSPEARTVSAKLKTDLSQAVRSMQGRELVFDTPTGRISGEVLPSLIRVFPWESKQVRLTVYNRETGKAYPIQFATVGEFSRHVAGQATPTTIPPTEVSSRPRSRPGAVARVKVEESTAAPKPAPTKSAGGAPPKASGSALASSETKAPARVVPAQPQLALEAPVPRAAVKPSREMEPGKYRSESKGDIAIRDMSSIHIRNAANNLVKSLKAGERDPRGNGKATLKAMRDEMERRVREKTAARKKEGATPPRGPAPETALEAPADTRGYKPNEPLVVPYVGQASYFGKKNTRATDRGKFISRDVSPSGEPVVNVMVRRGGQWERHTFPERLVSRRRNADNARAKNRARTAAAVERIGKLSDEQLSAKLAETRKTFGETDALARDLYNNRETYGTREQINSRVRLNALNTRIGLLDAERVKRGGAPDVEPDRPVAERHFGGAFDDEPMPQHAEAFGELVKKHAERMTPEAQESAASATHALALSPDGMRQVFGDWAASGTKATPAEYAHATHRLYTARERIVTESPQQIAELKAMLEHSKKTGDPGGAMLAKDGIEEVAAQVKAVRELAEEARSIAGSISDPEHAPGILSKIRSAIDAKLGEWSEYEAIPPGSPPMGDALGAVGHFVFRHAMAGVKRAAGRYARQQPKGSQDFRVTDKSGKTLWKERVVYEPDPYTTHAYYRMLARARMAPGWVLNPPELTRKYHISQQSEAFHASDFMSLLQTKLGPELARKFHAFSDAEVALDHALEGRKPALPKGVSEVELKRAAAAMREVYDEMHRIGSEFAEKRGGKRPGYIEGYTPHLRFEPEDPWGRLASLLEPGADAERLADLKNRFFEHREGDFTSSRRAIVKFHRYAHSLARWMAFHDYFAGAGKWLEGEGRAHSPARAAQLKDWIVANHMQKKTGMEVMMDDAARSLFVKQARGGVMHYTKESAEHLLGKKLPSVNSNHRVVVILKGSLVKFSDRENWVRLGEDGKGASVWAGPKKANVWPAKMPEPRGWLRKLGEAQAEMFARMSKSDDRAAEKRRAYAEWEDTQFQRLNQSPVDYLLSLWGRQQIRSALGLNTSALTSNAMNNALTTAPEHGIRATMVAAGRGSRATWRKVVRGSIDALAESGHVTANQAETARKMMNVDKIVPDELRAEAYASQQGELERARSDMKRAVEGPRSLRRIVFDNLDVMRPYGLVEDWTRAIDAVAAVTHGQRVGLKAEEIRKVYEATRRGRREAFEALTKDLDDPSTAGSYAMVMANRTMFHYDPMGRPPMFAGPWGQLAFRLMTFPYNYVNEWALRPMAGAGSVAAAAGRGVARAATGGKVGVKLPPEARGKVGDFGQKFQSRGQYPKPSTPFGKWLEEGGAGYEQRHAAKAFAYQLAVTGALLAVGDALHANLSVAGTSPVSIAALGVLRTMFPDNETFERWYKDAERAGVVHAGRGAASLPVPVGPAPSLLWDIATSSREASAAGEKAADGYEGVEALWEWYKAAQSTINPALAEILRMSSGLPVVQARRVAQATAGDALEDHPGVSRLGIGAKTALPSDATAAEKAKFLLGVETTEERERNRRRIAP